MAGDDVVETKKGGSKNPKNSNESKLKQKSLAEFFAENKNIAGFDNPGKSLYTTVRELVENALDSAESISELPEVEVTMNIPHIHLHEKKGNKEKWHGAEIQVVIEGNWTTYRVRGLARLSAVSAEN